MSRRKSYSCGLCESGLFGLCTYIHSSDHAYIHIYIKEIMATLFLPLSASRRPERVCFGWATRSKRTPRLCGKQCDLAAAALSTLHRDGLYVCMYALMRQQRNNR